MLGVERTGFGIAAIGLLLGFFEGFVEGFADPGFLFEDATLHDDRVVHRAEASLAHELRYPFASAVCEDRLHLARVGVDVDFVASGVGGIDGSALEHFVDCAGAIGP